MMREKKWDVTWLRVVNATYKASGSMRISGGSWIIRQEHITYSISRLCIHRPTSMTVNYPFSPLPLQCSLQPPFVLPLFFSPLRTFQLRGFCSLSKVSSHVLGIQSYAIFMKFSFSAWTFSLNFSEIEVWWFTNWCHFLVCLSSPLIIFFFLSFQFTGPYKFDW